MRLLYDGDEHARLTVVLGHGAGAPMDSPFMAHMAQGLAASGIRVVRIEFPYMEARRADGTRRPPDREPILKQRWLEAIDHLGGAAKLVIGGKSLGGRIASLIADEVGARGLICLGYPFHAPGRPERPRIDHLLKLRTPALIVQGTRDSLGNKAEVSTYELSPRIRIAWIEDGDHSFKPRKSSGCTERGNLDEAVAIASRFIHGLAAQAGSRQAR